uniref:NAD-dependent epimerase/dehydratase family protein n=1 Tax=Sphingomonas sp. TaxID=28214 RepID=UPI0025FA2E9A|nr:NAD-dependent epimerase/dehydratase family protein [Sphingomonas sp.]
MTSPAILVTGAAGFIGAAVSRALLARGDRVIGVDILNDYYDVRLKHARLAEVARVPDGRFDFLTVDFADHEALDSALVGREFDRIVHLGAQAGVRYSIENPRAYVHSNIAGHLNVLELARHRGIRHTVYASSSSIYGGDANLPFKVDDRADRPLSLYAATKRADELMSDTYAHLYRTPLTGLRFFTVYGPWGRPDMAMWLFTSAILEGRPIQVFNDGDMARDFTFIEDIVAGILACLDSPPADDGLVKAGGSISPHRLYNIGNNKSERLGRLIDLIEQACGKPAIRVSQPMQPGDMKDTFADIDAIAHDVGYVPTVSIEQGVPSFVDWYREYTGV